MNALAKPSPWLASLELGIARRAGRSALVHNRHQGPLVVQKALYPEGDSICHAVILHPPGGIAEADRLSMSVDVAAGAHAVLSTPSATRWYKSSGSFALQEVRLTIDEGASLEWLPQENLFFENARADQRLVIRAAPGARFLGWDAYMLGRTAHGESWQAGCVRLASELHVADDMIFTERGEIAGGDYALDGAPGLAGRRCGATLWALGGGVAAALVEELCQQLPYHSRLMAAASMPEEGLLVVRVLGEEAGAVRALLQTLRAQLRFAVLGADPAPLRLWAC